MEIALDVIHIFDATVFNDYIYVNLIYTSNIKISKTYKLDETTNSLIH